MSRGAKAGKAARAGTARDTAGEGPRPFGTLETGRLTWLGLAVALIGWAVLIAVTVLAEGPHAPRSALFHGDLMTIAQALIGSGFALAAIGTLQAGFGALDRFFSAALYRSSARAAQAAAPAEEEGPQVSRRQRPYRTFPDGSVEVETILGTRRFASMGDAREFI